MIIKSLTLNNFRQFIGQQKIDFASDPSKKVTIVMAESGVGKTTLLQSFQWVLYGKCSYNKILNEDIKNKMVYGDRAEVKVSLELKHSNKDYVITRKQTYYKNTVRVETDDSILSIDYKENGISIQKRGREANQIIKGFMSQDLFPYFFLEGESLTKVGSQMAKGKAGSNSEFVKAIKGLLGFNFLYDARKHLTMVENDYNSQIQRSTSNESLRNSIEDIQKTNEDIDSNTKRIEIIDTEISYNTDKRDELSEKLLQYGEIGEKQKRTLALRKELSLLDSRILEKKKQIFKYFSSNVIYLILDSMEEETRELLKKSDNIDKGIPGINAKAIQYLLDRKICVCGEKLDENSDHWKKLNDLLTFLPPNSIGTELKNFESSLQDIFKRSESFKELFAQKRKDLSDNESEYKDKMLELVDLNEQIKDVNLDVNNLKQQESSYNEKITELKVERQKREGNLLNLRQKLKDLEQRKILLESNDSRTKKIQEYCAEAAYLKKRIERFIDRRETETKDKLASAINDIFNDFYREQISFSIDSNYGVQIHTYNQELTDDFTSGGQDVAIALAFIASIIRLNSEKDESDDDMEETMEKECYPLVLDAPTSNFGMKQMDSFCEIMPKMTDQIIVFINDKDGPILIEKMKTHIGEKWKINKEETYRSEIVKGE